MLLLISLVGLGANHRNTFWNFVMGVELYPPIVKKLVKKALFFGIGHRLLGKTNESNLCGIAPGMGQGCAPRLAFGRNFIRGLGPGPQVIKYRYRTLALPVSLRIVEAQCDW